MVVSRGLLVWGSVMLAGLVLSGCGTRINKAPVEDRGTVMPAPGAVPGAVVSQVKPLSGTENTGRTGYYTVKPGDTLIRIGLETGQSWKDIARWNGIENPNLIEVGQILKVMAVVPSSAVVDGPGVVARPIVTTTLAPTNTNTNTNSTASPAASSRPANSPPAGGDDDVGFIWPSSGALIAGFDEARNKGYDINGKAGDPIVAAADGRVVYSGAGLRGYGNLIILKHNNTFLTAYAHNQTLLVKEDQSVRRGQKIAEMGSTDSDRVKLHFEIRRQGKPVDPSRYLPNR